MDKLTIFCINQKERTQKQTWHPYTLINLNATTAFGVILNWLPYNCQNKKITISHNIRRMKGTLISKYHFNYWTVYSIVWNFISLSLCPMPPIHGVEQRSGRYFRLSNLHLFNSSITLLTGVFDFAMAAIVPSFPLVTKNRGLIFKEYCLPFKYAVNLSVPYFILLFSSC